MILTATIAAIAFQQQAKPLTTSTLFVENLAFATYANKKWTALQGKQNFSNPFTAFSLDIGRVTENRLIYEVPFLEGIEANFIESSSGAPVLWSGPKPKYPRAIQIVNPAQADYLLVVKEFAKAQLKATPKFEVEINSIIRVDLDGDGKEEVLIEAQSKGFNGMYDFESKKYEMSCTLIRHIKNGKAVTEPIFFFTNNPEGEFNDPIQITHLKSIADLNGDGKYEVIVTANYYEGQSAAVYNLEKGTFKALVENGAGV